MSEEKIILKSSDESAKFVTDISGWADKDGRFYGDNEDLARYSGCTHVECEACGTIRAKNSYCMPCHQLKTDKRFEELEKKEWDGEIPLCIHDSEEYFFDGQSLHDYIEDRDILVSDLKLRLCKPVPMPTLDEDYLLDGLHEDAELPAEVDAAVIALNKAIMESVPICWEPDKYAAIINNN